MLLCKRRWAKAVIYHARLRCSFVRLPAGAWNPEACPKSQCGALVMLLRAPQNMDLLGPKSGPGSGKQRARFDQVGHQRTGFGRCVVAVEDHCDIVRQCRPERPRGPEVYLIGGPQGERAICDALSQIGAGGNPRGGQERDLKDWLRWLRL